MCDTKRESRVSDFFPDADTSMAFPQSKRVSITTIFDVPIVVHKIAWRYSTVEKPFINKYGRPALVIFEFTYRSGISRYNTHTYSKDVCDRLQYIQDADALPVRGTVVRKDDGSYSIE